MISYIIIYQISLILIHAQIYLTSGIFPSMDSRIYFHQNRRPRYSNPTYISNNVNTSLTFFDNRAYRGGSSGRTIDNKYEKHMQNSPLADSQRATQGYSMNKSTINNHPAQRYTTLNNYTQPQHSYHPIQPRVNSHLSQQNSHLSQVNPRSQRASSNLSSYGNNSLSLNQNDIFNKQNSKFNIITMKPKQFDTSIRQYPKYSLENKDQLYYKRMTDQLQKRNTHEDSSQQFIQKATNKESHEKGGYIAGKHTYEIEKERMQGNRQSGPQGNMISNPYNYQNATGNYGRVIGKVPIKQFTPKMLNHMDELQSLS